MENEKKFEVKNEKTQVKEILTESQIYEMLLPAMFTQMVIKLKYNEELFHHDTMLNFKRIV